MAGAAQAHKIVLGVVAGILVFVMHDLGGPAASGTEWIAPQLPPPETLPGCAVPPLGGAAPASVPGVASLDVRLIHPRGVFRATAAEVHAQVFAAGLAARPRRSLGHLPPPVILHEKESAAHAVCEPSLPKIRPAPGALSRGCPLTVHTYRTEAENVGRTVSFFCAVAVRALARICRTRRGVTPASGAISIAERP